jgi:shikimate kinase
MKIFLIGFMGSGKSFLGKKLAVDLGKKFYDLDREIETKEDLSIAQIFQTGGENYFRKQENILLKKWNKPGIIATGGGIVELEENRAILQQDDCITIWLNPSWEKLINNLKNSSDRPLFKQLSEEEFYHLWQKRIPFYKESADIVVNDPDLDKLVRSIKIYIKLNS